MSSGPYFNGMCLEELAAMYPYRVPAVLLDGEGGSGFSPAEFQAYLATLPTSDPHVLNEPWNNGGTLSISQG